MGFSYISLFYIGQKKGEDPSKKKGQQSLHLTQTFSL